MVVYRKDMPNLEIQPVETKKDDIKQPALASDENMWIPPLGSSVIICGKSGSGKTTLLQNYLTQ
jgi:ABC-type lipoprotein export system ATPase subunit